MKTTQSTNNSTNQQPLTAGKEKSAASGTSFSPFVVAIFGVLSMLLPVGETAQAQGDRDSEFVAPAVFQAAGPTAASIQSTVDAFRAALGTPNNVNTPGPLMTGRREINWDGGNPAIMDTTPAANPFNVFLNTRGSQFKTPGKGLSQGPPSGLATLFGNPTYAEIFKTFSPSRLFTPVGSNVTDASFFIPGSTGGMPATVTGFGAVFTDVDQPDGGNPRKASTTIDYFDSRGKRIFTSSVPASPGDGSQSFLGIIFKDARIASLRITAGNVAPGPNDDRHHDVVMMDDFIYGEPQVIQVGGVAQPELDEN